MATLRRKTTSSGVIIRWLPHPDHSRPSTYQVHPRAVQFLSDIGYAVPSPGDEVEIPWDVCRPLRILGDLYFKSETPGTVDTNDVGTVSDTFGQSLSAEQQNRLREYLESHEGYQDAQGSLSAEMDQLPEADKTGAPPDSTEGQQKPSDSDDPQNSLVFPEGVQFEEVDRISGSGNAMIKRDGGSDLNLGPLNEKSVGEPVPYLQVSNEWAICLTSPYLPENYLGFFEERGVAINGAASDIIESLPNSDPTRIYESLISGTAESTSVAEGLTVGEELTTRCTQVYDRLSVAQAEDQLIWVVIPSKTVAGAINIQITGGTEYGARAIAAPRNTSEDPFSTGKRIGVRLFKREDGVSWGIHDRSIVRIEEEVPQRYEGIQAGVKQVAETHIDASIESLDTTSRPATGEIVTVHNGALADYEDLPLTYDESPKVQSIPTKAAVTEVSPGSITLSIEPIAAEREIKAGSQLSPAVESLQKDTLIAVSDGLPILVGTEFGTPISEIQVEVTDITPTEIHAEVVESGGGSQESTLWEPEMVAGFNQLRKAEYTAAADHFDQAQQVVETESSYAQEALFNRLLAQAEMARVGGDLDEAIQTSQEMIQKFTEYDIDSSSNEKLAAETVAYHNLISTLHLVADGPKESTPIEGRKSIIKAKRELKDKANEVRQAATIADEDIRSRPHPVILQVLRTLTEAIDSLPKRLSTILSAQEPNWLPIHQNPPRNSPPEIKQPPSSVVEPYDSDRMPTKATSEHYTSATEAIGDEPQTLNFRSGQTEYTETVAIMDYVQSRADGHCEGCAQPAPFDSPEGDPYLELHHVDEFQIQAQDRPERVIALCPICHTRVHRGEDGETINARLEDKLEAGLGTLGER